MGPQHGAPPQQSANGWRGFDGWARMSLSAGRGQGQGRGGAGGAADRRPPAASRSGRTRRREEATVPAGPAPNRYTLLHAVADPYDPTDPLLDLIDLDEWDSPELDRRVRDLVARCVRLVELSVEQLAPACRTSPAIVARPLESVARRKAEELEREPS